MPRERATPLRERGETVIALHATSASAQRANRYQVEALDGATVRLRSAIASPTVLRAAADAMILPLNSGLYGDGECASCNTGAVYPCRRCSR